MSLSDVLPQLTVVVPFYNEQHNVGPLIEEITEALRGCIDFELVAIDDGSTDDTQAALLAASRRCPALRIVVHRRNLGQSAALASGVMAARAQTIATLDGDGQNPPAELPVLLAAFTEATAAGVALIVGRRHARRDSAWRLFCSRLANRVRRQVLRDGCDDTGCSLKIFDRDMFLCCPQFDHMHRFLPALAARAGARVVNIDVAHRARCHGHSKYGVGNRLWVGIVDIIGVAWLARRRLADKEDVHELR